MNFAELQAELRHFAAERDWQPLHTPKNLCTALMVEAAELAEIFQWMSPEESRVAHRDAAAKERIGAEVADVLLYLLQVADQSEIDIAQAVRSKLARNAVKYPATTTIARVSPAAAATPGTHVLLDYENVQPSPVELRAMVPDARQVWVFHGPQQKRVAERFASLGADVTAVPISQSGKNALDFHLSFYMGYIASRNQASSIVVVANDKGYGPMLMHAKAMGFAVRQVGYGRTRPEAAKAPGSRRAPASKRAAGEAATKNAPAKEATAKKAPARKAPAKKSSVGHAASKKATAKQAPATRASPRKAPATNGPVEKAPAKKAPAKKAAERPASDKASVATPAVATQAVKTSALPPDAAATIRKLAESLRKMGDKRPAKPTSLRRFLKANLGVGATDEAVGVALARLVADGVVEIDPATGASYPGWDLQGGQDRPIVGAAQR